MKNDSTSDHVINATATDIYDVLKNLSAGTHIIKINGEINNETINVLNWILANLKNKLIRGMTEKNRHSEPDSHLPEGRLARFGISSFRGY